MPVPRRSNRLVSRELLEYDPDATASLLEGDGESLLDSPLDQASPPQQRRVLHATAAEMDNISASRSEGSSLSNIDISEVDCGINGSAKRNGHGSQGCEMIFNEA